MKFFHYLNYYLSCPKVFLYSFEEQKKKKPKKRPRETLTQFLKHLQSTSNQLPIPNFGISQVNPSPL